MALLYSCIKNKGEQATPKADEVVGRYRGDYEIIPTDTTRPPFIITGGSL